MLSTPLRVDAELSAGSAAQEALNRYGHCNRIVLRKHPGAG